MFKVFKIDVIDAMCLLRSTLYCMCENEI